MIVKLEGTNIRHEGDTGAGTAPTLMDNGPGVVEERERQVGMNRNESSLHKVRFGQSIARSMERQAQAEAQANAPAPSQPSQVDALTQQVATMQATIERMASQPPNRQPVQYDGGVIGELQRRTAEMPDYGQQSDSPDYGGAPDPNNYDLWDDYGRAQYKRDLDAHVKEVTQRGVDADRATQQQAWAMGEIQRQCEAVLAKYGKDANYGEVANAAKLIHFNAGGELTVEQAYLQASNEIEARSGRRRRSSYLPGEVKGLGRIMEYHQQTGRAGQTKRGR